MILNKNDENYDGYVPASYINPGSKPYICQKIRTKIYGNW